MKVQPIDSMGEVAFAPAKPIAKSRLKRLFERQFLRSALVEKAVGSGDGKDHSDDAVSLDAMVFGFFEEGNHEKPPRGRCNCFHSNSEGSDDDDADDDDDDDGERKNAPGTAIPSDAIEAIKGLVFCASMAERNLLADASRILDKARNSKIKGNCTAVLAAGLRSLGYDAAICKSRWDKNPSFPAGEHEYVDAVVGGDRLLVDAGFRSEFEVARPSKTYRAIIQLLPQVFVGQPHRLQQIVAVASEAARQSLKKNGLHVPPWRRHEYMRTKWFSAYHRAAAVEEAEAKDISEEATTAAIEVVGSPWTTVPARPKPGDKFLTGLALALQKINT
ncbi:uncharacterized protein LOC122011647 [Zingiber officinale]|uniref:uncharacterized protein LOC122011647 n=1 Tax=Zingiber officinale TaxID=94328 RepID=UPI001C4D6F8A|nr:uncharacterized protein LOC122011647 [Zingiber officinale]